MSSEAASAPALRAVGLGKQFDRSPRPPLRAAVPWAAPRPRQPVTALAGVDLEVASGESVGIIGPNGSGKSTLLKLAAGIVHPTQGWIRCQGTVSSIIELGIGFHPDLSGSENAGAALVMGGLHPDAARLALPGIADFAELGEWMDAPLKHYSLGMQARLAFATATCTRPDVLVVDEILAVGDRSFQERCLERMRGMLAQGTALLIASHEMALVAGFCSRAVQLRHGALVDDGPAAEVAERYLRTSAARLHADPSPPMTIDDLRSPARVDPHARITVEADVTVHDPVAEPVVGVDLVLPTVDPDHVLASDLSPVPGLAGPGRYRLRGESSPIPLRDARWRVTVSLVSGARQRRSASRSTTVVMADRTHHGRAHFDFAAHAEVVPAAEVEASPSTAAAPTGTGRRVVALRALQKRYRPRGGFRSIGELVARVPRDQALVTALDHVDLDLAPGTCVGLIGPNGAGKSTLLRAIAGLTRLDAGSIETTGRVAAVLDLGSAFEREATGTENAVAFGVLLGQTEREVEELLPSIVALAEVADVVDAPVKQYSTGTAAKLALSVALHAAWDILLIDEVLAVGDEGFRRRVQATIARRCADGDLVVFVSHDLRMVEQLCSRTVRLEEGRVVDDGPSSGVVAAYGGTSWAGGTMDAVAPLRLQPLRFDRHVVPFGDDLSFTGRFLLEAPLPTVRLEVSYRHELGDRAAVADRELRERYTLYRATVVAAGDLPAAPGWYELRATVAGNQLAGACDVVVSAVDELDGTVLNESWERVEFGPERTDEVAGPVVAFTWQVEPVAGSGPTPVAGPERA